jgi:hypothetical protein
MKWQKLASAFWLCALQIAAGTAVAAEKLQAWCYYNSPPFVVDPATGAGLAQDLVGYLNTALAGKYQVTLSVVPRIRLNALLEHADKGVVVLAPDFVFGGVGSGQYLWTSPLLKDKTALLSRKDHPIEFTGPSSLVGVRFSGIRGHIYPPLQAAINRGDIQRQEVLDENGLLAMLARKRTDAVILPDTSIRYLMARNPKLVSEVFYSKGHLGEFTRRLMFLKGMDKERGDFERVVQAMGRDPAWIAILKKYGLPPL